MIFIKLIERKKGKKKEGKKKEEGRKREGKERKKKTSRKKEEKKKGRTKKRDHTNKGSGAKKTERLKNATFFSEMASEFTTQNKELSAGKNKFGG